MVKPITYRTNTVPAVSNAHCVMSDSPSPSPCWPPGAAAGPRGVRRRSQHFRLYVDPALLPLPAAFSGDNALAALETQWSDVATM